MNAFPSPILSLEACVQLRQQLSAENKTLVMTNGVFDLLHVGHLDYLEKARALGDVLLVALNDDESTRTYKGAGRPLVPGVERARLLLALEPVGAVTLFPDATADRLLRAIQPPVYAKGGDYTPQTLPEYATVTGYGGEVALIEYLPDHSTTRLIQTIKSLPET
jgi:D-beta-D-heptose 7-phosphate kinase/D-beta-D-heptose 1-phosphate adenosyltransferase